MASGRKKYINLETANLQGMFCQISSLLGKSALLTLLIYCINMICKFELQTKSLEVIM